MQSFPEDLESASTILFVDIPGIQLVGDDILDPCGNGGMFVHGHMPHSIQNGFAQFQCYVLHVSIVTQSTVSVQHSFRAAGFLLYGETIWNVCYAEDRADFTTLSPLYTTLAGVRISVL